MHKYRDYRTVVTAAQEKIPGLHIEDYSMTHYIGDSQLSPGCRSCKEGTWYCIYVTKKCNMRCLYCPSKDQLLNQKDHDQIRNERNLEINNNGISLTVEEFKELFAQKKELINGVSYSGGEPFLALDKIVELARITKYAKPSVYQWVYTNGSLVTKEKLKILRDCQLDEIRFDWAAQNFKLGLLSKMEESARVGFKVTVEVPMYDRDIIRAKLMPQLKNMANAGVSQLNCAELLLNKNNKERLKIAQDELYRYEDGLISPIWSRQLTYEVMREVVKDNITLLINDCSNDAKQLQKIQRSVRPDQEKRFLAELIKSIVDNNGQQKGNISRYACNIDLLDYELRKHELYSFLYHNLEQCAGKDSLPSALIEKWKRISVGASLRDEVNANIFKKLVKDFHEQHLSYLILNGFNYADLRVNSSSYLPFNNLDFLVKTEEYGSIKSLLLQHGFDLIDDDESLSKLNDEVANNLADKRMVIFTKMTGKIEFNLRVITNPLLRGKLINSTDIVDIAGIKIHGLNPSAYLAYLLTSYSLDAYHSGWMWFIEIYSIQKYYKGSLDWKLIDSIVSLSNNKLLCKTMMNAICAFSENEAEFKNDVKILRFIDLLNHRGEFQKAVQYIDYNALETTLNKSTQQK